MDANHRQTGDTSDELFQRRRRQDKEQIIMNNVSPDKIAESLIIVRNFIRKQSDQE